MSDPAVSLVDRPLRIVAVDDDPGIRALLEVTIGLDPRFQLVGMAASAADVVVQVAEAGRDAPVDVVLVDVSLPDGNGIEVLPELRALAPNARIALFTGWSDAETAERALAAGADAVYEKTGDPIRTLEQLCSLHQPA